MLVINGADLPQDVTVDFAELEQKLPGDEWSARDVWAAKELGVRAGVSTTLPPHDCLLLVLTPPAAPIV